MSALLNAPAAQPAELSLLVDLEARWENLRVNRAVNAGKEDTVTHLHQKQKAYEAFHNKLAAYNKTFKPAHVAELLLNTPQRLGEWCRKMRDLYGRLEQSSSVRYPAHLMEKAYRAADRVAERLQKGHIERPAATADASGAMRELDALAAWCESVTPAE